LGKTPFAVLYGHEPKHFGIDISQSCQVADLNNWLHERELMQHIVRQHLVKAQCFCQLILDRRLRRQNDITIPQVLVQWSFLPPELSTWEDEDDLRQQFPRSPAWGQAGTQGRGGVSLVPL